MDRTHVVLPAEDIRRQKDFIDRLASIYCRREHPPMAMVDTYGCPNVRV